MNVEMRSDFPVNDEACKSSTGKTLQDWFAVLDSRPDLANKRRDAISLVLYPEMGKDLWWATTAWVERERRDGTVQKDGRLEGYNICVTKKVVAPLEKVFSLWVTDEIANWFGDSPSLDVDKSISDSTGNQAKALRVRDQKDLRYTWTSPTGTPSTQVEVAFKEEPGGKVLVTLMHNRIQTREEADGLRRAWGDAFTRMKAQLES